MNRTPVASSVPVAVGLDRASFAWRSHASAVWDLTKPRLAAMSVLTTMVAYVTARPNGGSALATGFGTTLAAAGALSLNQWWERGADALMQRTQGRPLPRHAIGARAALGWSVAFSASGVAWLAVTVNAPAAAIALATILIYGVIYTPLKRRSRWATEVGAVSGALPALIGNAAAGDLAARPGLVLTAVLLFWQMPHFFAVGWRHRADYRVAGFRLRPTLDPDGANTARWSLGYAIALLGASLVPWVLGWVGGFFAAVAVVAGAGFVWRAWCFLCPREREREARRFFFASLAYLPALLAALLADCFWDLR